MPTFCCFLEGGYHKTALENGIFAFAKGLTEAPQPTAANNLNLSYVSDSQQQHGHNNNNPINGNILLNNLSQTIFKEKKEKHLNDGNINTPQYDI